MRYLVVPFFWFILLSASAQDSTMISLQEILDLATRNHPIVKQAGLQDRFAKAEVLSAQGKFDPKLQSEYNRKDQSGKTYYNKFYSALKVPVWFPIDPKVELSRNEGSQLNPESYISNAQDYWQVTAGVSLPIGKGLFIDERRMLVKQAKIYSNIAEAEKIKLTNKTLLSITKSYWDWYYSYKQYELMVKSLDIAKELFRRTKLDHDLGEASIMDTVQAKITYQSRIVDFEKAKLSLLEARLGLSVHLWDVNDIPLEMAETAYPSEKTEQPGIVPNDTGIQRLTAWSLKNHPEIQKLMAKQSQMEVQERWNKESFKPEINLNYSLIDAPVNIDGTSAPDWQESYKLGMEFSFPLLLRKERGSLQKTRVYQESMAFDLLQTQQELQAEINTTFASIKTNEQLVRQYQSLAENYETLLRAEIFNVENGASDLFKLNIQQDKFIQAQLKYLNAQVKLEKLKAQLPYVIGLPFLSYNYLYE